MMRMMILTSLSHWMSGKAQLREDVCVALVVLDVSLNSVLCSDTVSESSVSEGWLHVYLNNKNGIIFCLYTLRRSRTETASSHGCLASEFVCQRVSPCDRVKHVCSLACYKYGNNLEISSSWWAVALHGVVCYFLPLTLIHSRGADWLSAAWVQRDVVFISLDFRVRLWSLSCWLRVNMQHLITSLGFCLKGHKGPMYHYKSRKSDEKLESSLRVLDCLIVFMGLL